MDSKQYIQAPTKSAQRLLSLDALRGFATWGAVFWLATLPGTCAIGTEPVEYLTLIKPVLAERCYACHGTLKQEGGLRLDTALLALQGGDSGPAIEPGNASASLLVERITASDESERMPAEGLPLTPQQIAALREWINQGAPAPNGEQPEPDPRRHWAFKPIERPPIPDVANSAWIRNPIDAFVAQQHDQFELRPQAEAPRALLVRRLYLDLIGMSPSDDEIDAGSSNDWYESLTDRLLNDPRHGERWARHWMDIWRYSDWWGLGEQLRNSQHHVWHWRDWIVDSLNENVPYDEMISLMLAADELHPTDQTKLRATGFLARNWALFGRNLWMEETVEHVSKGFLGLTMNCVKCHDHKYEPIDQVDFYRMRAFFEPYHVRMDMVPGQPDLSRDGIPRVFDGVLDAPTYRFERGQESQPDKSQPIAPGVPAFLTLDELTIEPVPLPKEAWQPERQPWVLESYIAAAKDSVTCAEQATAVAKEKLAAAEKNSSELPATTAENSSRESAAAAVVDAKSELHAGELAVSAAQAELTSIDRRAAAMRSDWAAAELPSPNGGSATNLVAGVRAAIEAERAAAVAKARHTVAETELRLCRSSADAKAGVESELATAREALSKAEQVAAADITADDKYTRLVGAKWSTTRFLSSVADDPQVYFHDHSTGRRTALAVWITDRRNPLTARVAVNHIWARHMGTPLVATVFDFGRRGTPPTHPELLNWLAAEFIESGWDMKHLHRLIVTSATYRMSSSAAGRDAELAKDRGNLRLWRRTPMRLESEVVRDSILSLAGKLDLSRGGPPVLPAAQADSTRRSLYFFHSNNERNVFLMTFDGAGVKECYRREQSVLPQQALALSNSRLVHDAAGQIAGRLSQSDGAGAMSDEQFIQEAFRTVLGFEPTADELHASSNAMHAWRQLAAELKGDSAAAARRHLIWALFNHNDFVTVH